MSIHGEMGTYNFAKAEEICENEKVVKFVNTVAPAIVRHGVKAVTGSQAAGDVAGQVMSGLAKSHAKKVATAVTYVAVDAGSTLLAIAMVPLIPVLLIKFIFFDD